MLYSLFPKVLNMSLTASIVILIMHWSNMVKAFKGTDFNARDVVKDRMVEKKEK